MTVSEGPRLTKIRADVAAETLPLPLGAIGEGAKDGLCADCSTFERHADLATCPTAPAGHCLGCGQPIDTTGAR